MVEMAALNIKDDEVHALAAELARRTGVSLTEAVKRALQQQLQRNAPQARQQAARAAVALGREIASLPILDARSTDEILEYGEDGLFR